MFQLAQLRTILSIGLFAAFSTLSISPKDLQAQALQQLSYNHPGLVVDLGVGLWACPVPWDADNDGDFDLIVSCPDKPSNGIWFFENKQGDTSQNKFPIFEPGRKLSKTVHYITPSYVDGGLRVMSPGKEYPQFAQSGLNIEQTLPIKGNFYRPQWNEPKGPKVRHNQWRYVDYDDDGALDLVVGIEDWSEYGWDDAWNSDGQWTHGPLHGFVILFHNQGSTAAPKYAEPQKIQSAGKDLDVFGCPSPNFVDFDNDGDLDLLCGEFLDGFTYFANRGTRKQPIYAEGTRLKSTDGQPLVMDLEMIVPVAFDWDRDGDSDLIVGDEDGRVALIENVTDRNTKTDGAIPQFLKPRYFQQHASTLKCGALATPVGVDWDNDGDTDILSGNTAGYIEFFENLDAKSTTSDGSNTKWAAPVKLKAGDKIFRIMAGKNMSIQGPAEAKWGYTTFSVADWDGDGLRDIVLNSILGKVQWLKNVGTANQPQLSEAMPVEVEWPAELKQPPKPAWTWWTPQGKELVTQWRTTPVVHDFNGDGLNDLAMLDPEGYLSFFAREKRADGQLVLMPPERKFVDEKGAPLRLNSKTAGGSGRRKLCVVDWDRDGKLDILLNSANADLYRGLSPVDGKWPFKASGTLAEQNIEGHDVSPSTIDLNKNGIPDFLGGAEDGRMYVLMR